MEFEVFDLGLVGYQEALELQRDVFHKVKENSLKAAVIICRHHPVITLGRSAKKENIRPSANDLQAKGIELYEAERGGDATYHGPGQLVIYPVFNLSDFKKDIHLFLRSLEEKAIQVLGEYGISAQTRQGFTGVWIGADKIASIGIAVKNWITYHGLAINVKKDDLSNFSLIRPCGLDIKMTSMESVLNREISLDEVKKTAKRRFAYG